MSRDKIIGFIAVGAVLFAAIIWWSVPKSFRRENPSSQESLNRLAAEINRAVPVMIDKETELLSSAGAEGMLIYNYRLVSYSVSQFSCSVCMEIVHLKFQNRISLWKSLR